MIRIPRVITSKDGYKLLLILFWGQNFLCSYVRAVFLRLPLISLFADAIIPALSLLCFLVALPYIKERIAGSDLLFFLIAALVYCVNLLIYPETREYLLEIAPKFWLSVFPLFFLGLRLDPEEDLSLLYYVSLINIWLHFVYVLVFGEGFSQEQSLYAGSMGRAYMVLPQLQVIFIFVIRKTNFMNLLTMVLGSVYLFTCGTRGAIVCLFVFIFLCVAAYDFNKKKLLLYIFTAMAMLMILLFYDAILIWMRTVAIGMGMSERIFNYLQSGQFFISNSRNLLAENIVKAIVEKPVLGYGIAGDREHLGVYSHNLYLELMASFGVVQGTMLLAGLVFLIVRAYLKSKNRWTQEWILLLVCAVFLKLFLSSSYLLEGLFFLMLGVCISQNRVHRQVTKHDIGNLGRNEYESM